MPYTPSPQLLAALRAVVRTSGFTTRARGYRSNSGRRREARTLHHSQHRALRTDASSFDTHAISKPPSTPILPSAPLESVEEPRVSFRKQLKEEAKARKLSGQIKKSQTSKAASQNEKWEITIGIEIHAELNTAHKLFSYARTSLNDIPNTHVAVFDAAMPGAQPIFQRQTLLPALRAAIALGCEVQRRSGWDRKHYFWWDQPNGYQITQYYQPFATNGSLTLYAHDDIDPIDYPEITIGIKQIQMEQDTAKTTLQPPSTHLLDFNRVSHPLIEIISLPHIHSPKTAAAFVRKIQSILKSINASTTGMEMGGLRADVNVSVKQRGDEAEGGGLEYAGVTGLGQRTEIKNLSSFKAVEDAIVAESHRQIEVLEDGGIVLGETRGWTLGSGETRRLRGKEGEVDYRYMPDPDLGPVVIGDDLVQHLRATLPPLPDDTLKLLTEDPLYGLTMKDAKTLMSMDDGDRIDYYISVVKSISDALSPSDPLSAKLGKFAANWVLHELPTHIAPATSLPLRPETTTPFSSMLLHLLQGSITLPTAKTLLPRILSSNGKLDVPAILSAENLILIPMCENELQALAGKVVQENGEMARKVHEEFEKGEGRENGKVMWFVGQMVRRGEDGRIQPERAEMAVRQMLGLGEVERSVGRLRKANARREKAGLD